MRNTFVWVFISSLSLHVVMGCIFQGEELYEFYHHPRRSLSLKKKALLDAFPECTNDIARQRNLMVLSAGPFNITNAYSKVNDSKAYNYKVQGGDWAPGYPICGKQKQTPINIATSKVKAARYAPLSFVGYNKIHPDMDIINNGLTVDIRGPWGEAGIDVPTMSGGPLNGSYKLYGVHFHWGYTKDDGSEHMVNYRSSALEMHMVHYSAKFPNITAAVNANLPDSLAVVGFLFNPSHTTSRETLPLFRTLTAALNGQIVLPAAVPLDLVYGIKSYWTYDGSLTTPPCNEIVRWILVENPIFKIHPNDLAVFTKFLKDGKPILGNYREIQPMNGRTVNRGTA